ncbi:hypothetical protein [Xylophilus sp. ASV27]|uniref:hypothetical protein n=1 Tax=Xylophilus sp. ASV27 TaxID=2795129 RepID=UPI001E341C8E|nr:hypothetical protein [Xylophilus sp. ASV27]
MLSLPFPAPCGALALVAALLASPCALAQTACSSDGEPAPRMLLERFLNADCEACWADAATPRPDAGTLVLDWIVPRGEDGQAPLAAGATRDAERRLAALRRATPRAGTEAVRTPVAGTRGTALRVARGPVVADYVGASIAWTAPLPRGGATAWLLLVEALPPGTDGSPVARMLVRNALVTTWAPQPGVRRFSESRPMNIPDGADPERLRVLGWLQDAQGRIVAAAQSRCRPVR